MIRLEREQYPKVRALFRSLHYQLSVESLLDGTNPGYVSVDDAKNPTCAWMYNSEGFFLAGNPQNHTFNSSLREWFDNYNRAGIPHWEGEEYLLFDIDSDSWIPSFPEIFSQRPPLEVNRIHYLCDEVKIDWRASLPEDFSIRRIDKNLLHSKDVQYPDHINYWIKLNWGSPHNYLKLGFGTCVVHNKKVVSYSLSDCISGDECEIGIQTLPEYRRRGLATITAAANVEYAFSIGFRVVGWHTHDYNIGSQRTAESVGFSREREYTQYVCLMSEAMHIAETGMRQFFQGRQKIAIEFFENSFNIGEVEPWVYFLCARSYAIIGEFNRAMDLLHLAVDHGWTDLNRMLECEDLLKLHDYPKWSMLITRMESEANPKY
jgi:RimJ/RimL family protein N-acetyltransferase